MADRQVIFMKAPKLGIALNYSLTTIFDSIEKKL